jgi:hypothetical protein
VLKDPRPIAIGEVRLAGPERGFSCRHRNAGTGAPFTSTTTILLIDSRRRMVERQQRNPDGTWTLSEHTSGGVVVLEHEVSLDELYEGVAVAAAR